MGNCVGTISWDKTPDVDDIIILSQLQKIMEMYNLEEADPHLGVYNSNKTAFHVQIAGVSIPWNGGVDKCKQRIGAFLDESKQFIQRFGLQNVDTYTQFMPM